LVALTKFVRFTVKIEPGSTVSDPFSATGAVKPARKTSRTAKTPLVAPFVDPDLPDLEDVSANTTRDFDNDVDDVTDGNFSDDNFSDDNFVAGSSKPVGQPGGPRRDFDDDIDIVAFGRDLPLIDIAVPRVAKPVIDHDDEFVTDTSFIAILDPSLESRDDDLDGFEDREDGEEDDEADVELLEALSSPTRPGLRSTIDVPLTSSDYNERNQELFGRRNTILAKIDSLEKKEAKKKLSRDDEDDLRRTRFILDEATKAIIEFNYGLVLNYVRKFTSTTSRDDSADFEAAGVVGLMRAVSSYDPTRGTKFSTWAYKPIQREILKAVRDADFKQLNPGDFEKRPEILRAVKALQNGNDEFIPTFEAVAVQAGATLDAVKRILNAPIIDSLSAPMGEDGDSSLTDMIEDPSAGVEDTALARQEIMDLERFGLSCLDERELFVIGRRFGLDGEPPQRLSAIGSLLGLSREAVRQVEAKALSKLLHPVTRRRLVRHGRR
jgi:RNA polymerase sigma factor (sigma-70 family)